jgi:hypothetical protein
MQLADDGRLYLDAPIRFYLLWFQIADEKAAAEITSTASHAFSSSKVDHLHLQITHRSFRRCAANQR